MTAADLYHDDVVEPLRGGGSCSGPARVIGFRTGGVVLLSSGLLIKAADVRLIREGP